MTWIGGAFLGKSSGEAALRKVVASTLVEVDLPILNFGGPGCIDAALAQEVAVR